MRPTFRSLAFLSALVLFGCTTSAIDESTGESTEALVTSVRHDEVTFAARDGLRLYAQAWRPSGPAKAHLVIVHGLKDHSSRYAPVATELAARGYSVHAFDLRGHGRSDGQRVWVSPFDRYVDDLEDFIHRVEAEEPGKPVFLFGHSMGGAIATLCALDRTPELGLVLSGAALTTGGDVPPLLRPVADFVARTGLAAGTAGILGALPGPLGREIASAPIFKLDNADFSRDPAVVEDMGRDPLIYQPPGPAITAFGLVDAMGRIQKRMSSLRVPLLVLHGSADKLTNPDGSRELYERASSADKTFRLYPGLFHDLLHEPEKEQVKTDLFEWLGARRAQ